MVLLDAEFILLFINTKTSKNLEFVIFIDTKTSKKLARMLRGIFSVYAEFFLLFIDTKTSKNKSLFAEKSYFSDEYSKWASF